MKELNMNKIWLLVGVAVLLGACSRDDRFSTTPGPEIRGLVATIDDGMGTRASAPAKVSVGRTEFAADDKLVFTTIKRTAMPLAAFTYSDIRYYFYEGVSWERIEGNLPEKIYWTDASSDHTFIGYSLPTAD